MGLCCWSSKTTPRRTSTLSASGRSDVDVWLPPTQRSTATHITCTNTRGAPLTVIPMCLDRVAWAAMSYAGPRTSFSSEAMGSVGPGAAPKLQARKERRGLPWSAYLHSTDLPSLSTQRHRVQRSTYHLLLSTLVQCCGRYLRTSMSSAGQR